MKIAALRLFNVKRFAGRGVAIEGIGDGVNVLCAVNEHGKSTSFEALHALFFQPHSGTPGDVQRLRPYSGGNPLIEVDITNADGRFRITKQYYGGRFARVVDLATERLVAQADEAEAFIGNLVKGGTAGPAGLLWVRQGVTGIEKRSRAEEESEKQVRAGLLESVQGEVEAVTGGRRMAGIMAAAEVDLDPLVTATGKPKASGLYDAAIRERDRLAAEEERLSKEVAALRGALDRRAAAERRRSELEKADDRRGRREAVEKAQAALDAAKGQAEVLRTAQAELNHAVDRRDGAERSLKDYRAAAERARALAHRLVEVERARSDALDKRRAILDELGKANADAEAAEVQEQEAQSLLARLDAAMRARDGRERHAESRDRLEKAERVRSAIEAGEADLARVSVEPHSVEALRKLDSEVAKLRAVAEAARPTVTVAYEPAATGRILMDGVPLTGEERGYDGQALLAVPGIGTITLRSNRPAHGDDRLKKAEAQHRDLLAAMGVGDLAAALARQARAQGIEADLRGLRGQLTLLAPQGLPKLREAVQGAVDETIDPEAPELKADPAATRTALGEAVERRKTARLALREVEPRRISADDALRAAGETVAELKAERVQVEAILGPEEGRGEREHSLADNLAGLDTALTGIRERVDALRASAVDPETAAAVLRRVRSVEDAAEKELATLRETVSGLNGEIRTRSDEAVEEQWRETADAHAAAQARVQAFAREVAVLQRLSSALEAARSGARELYLKPVLTELKPLLGLLFDDVSITFDDRTLLPHRIRRNGQDEDVERLSGGMREQLSVLTRLAFARLLAREQRPAPVILDDALAYSDDDRIEKMFDALHRQSRDQQIIVFSCRQRAFQRLGGNILQLTDWQPPVP